MSEMSPYLKGEPVSDAVRRVQVDALLVKGPRREPAALPPAVGGEYKRKTLLERTTRKA